MHQLIKVSLNYWHVTHTSNLGVEGKVRETRKNQDGLVASDAANHLIGYERLLDYFKQAQSECPKGVGLKKESKPSGTYVLLQFKLGEKRPAKACNCNFTLQGIGDAVKKAHQVAEALKQFSSESDFWEWYERTILEKNVIKNDLITFGDAIKVVENNYWSANTKKRQKRDKLNPSHQACWIDTYQRYYNLLPLDKIVNLADIKQAIESKEKGSRSRKYCVSAMKRLAEAIGNNSIYEELKKIDVTQTKFKDLQNISLDDFLQLRKKALDITNDARYNLESRKAWLFVFSMQVIYGLRIHEVFAIQNIDKPFKTKDGVTIAALKDPKNSTNIIVIGNETILGTTTKTGYRLSIPLIPPSQKDLIEKLEIKYGQLPTIGIESVNPKTIRNKYAKEATRKLATFSKETGVKVFSQTHALRHLANLNGLASGIPIEKRAMSLGHSPTMNDTVYKKRQTTKTTIDLLAHPSNQAIALEAAVNLARQITGINHQQVELLARIYNTTEEIIREIVSSSVDSVVSAPIDIEREVKPKLMSKSPSKISPETLIKNCGLSPEREKEAIQIIELFQTHGVTVAKHKTRDDIKCWKLIDQEGNRAGLYLNSGEWSLAKLGKAGTMSNYGELKGFFEMTDFYDWLGDNDIELE
ncbi:hypothetical protein [Aerosakkonema funiforme]|uniref:hypothetical protein n=1 Tax=Aerosakkonema funiforme TaxID=1246630 RepID=UPI0035BAD5B3